MSYILLGIGAWFLPIWKLLSNHSRNQSWIKGLSAKPHNLLRLLDITNHNNCPYKNESESPQNVQIDIYNLQISDIPLKLQVNSYQQLGFFRIIKGSNFIFIGITKVSSKQG